MPRIESVSTSIEGAVAATDGLDSGCSPESVNWSAGSVAVVSCRGGSVPMELEDWVAKATLAQALS